MAGPSLFQRIVLPGLAFKAVVIGGGYATGRELAQFFLPGGPIGGLLGLGATTLLWSIVCVLTFLFARATGSFEYRSFFKALLGRFWVAFEIVYVALTLLVVAVFGAAAGEIVHRLGGGPPVVGMLLLGGAIVAVTTYGNRSVERLFKWVSLLLYGTYALFAVLGFYRFGGQIEAHWQTAPAPHDWLQGGLTYGAYNLLGAVAILPVVRHMRSNRDAIVSGLLCGPLAVIPAVLFFSLMSGFYPEIGQAVLPSDELLSRLDIPAFRVLFQVMVFMALLEGGTALVHGLNQRLATVMSVGRGRRLAISAALCLFALFVAARVGLIQLIATGYGASALFIAAVYLVPLLTLGLKRIVTQKRGQSDEVHTSSTVFIQE